MEANNDCIQHMSANVQGTVLDATLPSSLARPWSMKISSVVLRLFTVLEVAVHLAKACLGGGICHFE